MACLPDHGSTPLFPDTGGAMKEPPQRFLEGAAKMRDPLGSLVAFRPID